MNTYRILVAEDDGVIAGQMKKSLEKWGYEVKLVEDFGDVLKPFADFKPHLVLMDIVLPFYNGHYWCARIRELAESTLFPKSGASDFTDTCALVMADWTKIEEAVFALETDSAPLPVLRIEMNPQGEAESILDFYEALWEAASAREGFASCMDDQEQILNNRGMFGGLLFVGISFGLLFLLCLLVSMYYKQIAEGFEDQESFAILHTVVGSHMVILLMGTINLYNKGLVLGTGAAVCILFVAVYLFCYRRTARTYYRIVKW